jgi:hypothetical protein
MNSTYLTALANKTVAPRAHPMHIAIVISTLLGGTSLGDTLPFSSYTSSVFALRASAIHRLHLGEVGDQGIWRYDSHTDEFRRVAPFAYRGEHATPRLAAYEDRIVVQGADYHEFDIASGRLLRRYQTLHPTLRAWRLHGPFVPQAIADELGIPAGTYGFLSCPGGVFCPPFVVPEFGEVQDNEQRNRDVLFFRSYDPADAQIRWAMTFPTDPAAPNVSARGIAIGSTQHALFSFTNRHPTRSVLPLIEELHSLETTGGVLTQGNLLRRRFFSSEPVPEIKAFTYVPRLDRLFHITQYRAPFSELLFRYESLLGEGNVIERVTENTNNNGEAIFTDAIASLPDALPANYEQLVPVIGNGPGANGTYWRSDLFFYNPSTAVMDITYRRVSTPDVTRTMSLAPHASTVIRDVLAELGGGPSGDGVTNDGILITAPYRWGSQLSAYSRTYTLSADGGTFGQAVPAVPSRLGYTNHHSEFISTGDSSMAGHSMIILDKRNYGQYRHNIGVVNDTGTAINVRLRYGVVSSLPVTDPDLERTITVPAHTVSNTNLEQLFPERVVRTRSPRIWITADTPAPIWLSIVDNITGDATFVPYTLYALRGTSTATATVPAVAHSPGALGSFWRTDLYGFFPIVDPDESPQQPLVMTIHGGCSSQARLVGETGADTDADSYWHNVFPDVARQVRCDETGSLAALRVRISSWTAGFTRTYTTRADGGTFGEMLPFFPPNGWPVQHFAGVVVDEHFRSNLGLHNGMDRDATYQLQLYDRQGMLIADVSHVLSRGETRQAAIRAWFKNDLPVGIHGLTVIPLADDSDQGRSWAYVAIVDNRTNDPTIWW